MNLHDEEAWATRLLINKYEPTGLPARRAPRTVRLPVAGLARIAPDRAARLAERLYFSPRRYPTPPRERAWTADASAVRFTTDSGALAALRWTPSPFPWERTRGTVLLAHGWEGRGAQLGALAKPLTDRGFAVVALDAPAHGRSPGRETDLFAYGRAMCAVAAELGDVRAVVAHSAGSAATFLALHAGLNVGALALLSPPSDFNWVAASFARAIALPEDAERRFRARIAERLGADVWQRFSMDSIAPHLTMPGLIIHDEDDDELPILHAETLQARWPGATLARTTGLGHRRIVRDPVVVERVARFVDGAIGA